MTRDRRGRGTSPAVLGRTDGGVLVRAWGGLRWYLREVTGEAAYDRYVQELQRTHPDRPPLDRRAFYRARQDEVEKQPQQRCC